MRRCDVLAATAVNHPEVTSAVEDLAAKGLSVFSLLSDFAQGVRAGYMGLNNLKVGRTAGWAMAQAVRSPGVMAIFVGGHRWHGHELRGIYVSGGGMGGALAALREARPAGDMRWWCRR